MLEPVIMAMHLYFTVRNTSQKLYVIAYVFNRLML